MNPTPNPSQDLVRIQWNPDPPTNLTQEETRVLHLLASAWNEFERLDKKHPDDNDDFRRAIHQAQQLIALRVARRVDPLIWKQPEEHGTTIDESGSGAASSLP